MGETGTKYHDVLKPKSLVLRVVFTIKHSTCSKFLTFFELKSKRKYLSVVSYQDLLGTIVLWGTSNHYKLDSSDWRWWLPCTPPQKYQMDIWQSHFNACCSESLFRAFIQLTECCGTTGLFYPGLAGAALSYELVQIKWLCCHCSWKCKKKIRKEKYFLINLIDFCPPPPFFFLTEDHCFYIC